MPMKDQPNDKDKAMQFVAIFIGAAFMFMFFLYHFVAITQASQTPAGSVTKEWYFDSDIQEWTLLGLDILEFDSSTGTPPGSIHATCLIGLGACSGGGIVFIRDTWSNIFGIGNNDVILDFDLSSTSIDYTSEIGGQVGFSVAKPVTFEVMCELIPQQDVEVISGWVTHESGRLPADCLGNLNHGSDEIVLLFQVVAAKPSAGPLPHMWADNVKIRATYLSGEVYNLTNDASNGLLLFFASMFGIAMYFKS